MSRLTDSPASTNVSGSCLCGRVRMHVAAFERHVVACHCGQCRKQTGSYYHAASVLDKNLTIEGREFVKHHAASDFAKRGFCGECGSALYWKYNESDATSVMVGHFDNPTGLRTVAHIFVADKGDYYELDPQIPQYPQSDS